MTRIIWKKNSSTHNTSGTWGTCALQRRLSQRKARPEELERPLRATAFGKYESLKYYRQLGSLWEQLRGMRLKGFWLRNASVRANEHTAAAAAPYTSETQPSFRHPTFGKYDIPWYRTTYACASFTAVACLALSWWTYVSYVGLQLFRQE